MDNPTTTIIRLPDNNQELIDKLERKLVEYALRYTREAERNPFTAPELLTMYYSTRILSTLLRNGFIDTWDLSREIAEEHGGFIADLHSFEKYCGIIKNYVDTNGDSIKFKL